MFIVEIGAEVITLAARDGFDVERVEGGVVLPLVAAVLDVLGELASVVLVLTEDLG